MDFWKNIRQYLWNAELLLLIFRQDKKKKRGCLQVFEQLNFRNDTPEIKSKGNDHFLY